MAVMDRYPTWVLLLLAVAAVGALAGTGLYVDRRSPEARRFWIPLLAAYLAVVGLAWAGAIPSRGGGLIAPNTALLGVTDTMVALLVAVTPAVWWQRRRGHDRSWMYGGRGGVLVGVVAFTIVGALLFGEIELASALRPPPAIAACDAYYTWNPPGLGPVAPQADRAVLAKAVREAPAGRLRNDLAVLEADVQAVVSEQGTVQGVLDEQRIPADMNAVTLDCRSVPPG